MAGLPETSLSEIAPRKPAPAGHRQKRPVKDGKKVGQLLVTPVGLRFPENLSFADWEGAGRQLARITDSFMWCLGDWVAYGLKKYTDRYYRAIQEVGLDYKTLRNYTWVARRFEWSRRRADLSFQHHAEVAALPPDKQDEWLDRAARQQWSRNQLRQQLRAARSGLAEDGSAAVAVPKLAIRHDGVEEWRRAAEMMDMQLEEWIVIVLDNAAGEALKRSA